MGRLFQEEQEILNIFHAYIHTKHCAKCHHEFIIANAKYCPMCGNNKIAFGKDKVTMHYKTYQYYPDGRVRACVRCQNEEIGLEDNFCIICGANTFNKCYGTWVTTDCYGNGSYSESTSCNHILPPNARFCSYCGGISEYYYHNILKSWEDECKALNQTSEILSPFSLLTSSVTK